MEQAREGRTKSREDSKAVGRSPEVRLTEDEKRRLAEFFILLDQLDRAQAGQERKAA